MASSIYPSVDHGVQKGAENFAGGTHPYGRIENKDHAFHGLDFIHTERSKDAGWYGPGFAAFVSSVIETGTPPSAMAEVHQTLRDRNLEAYDRLSPVLIDVLAACAAKANRTYREA